MTDILHRTFLDLLDNWIGHGTFNCADISFDNNICIKTLLPSLSVGMSPIKIIFFLNVFNKNTLKYTKRDGKKFYEISFDEKEFKSFQNFCNEEQSPVYYIIGIAKNSIFELTDKRPADRFDLYIVDLKQVFSYCSKRYIENTILIPSHNILNLSLFSLIWASQWVVNFFSPLYSREIINIPKLYNAVKNIFFTVPVGRSMKEKMEEQKKFLSKDLPTYKNELPDDLYKKISLRVSLGVVLNDVNTTLLTSSSIDQIINYCPESLYGTTNFWLFSKIYHQFMKISAEKATKNIRILPFNVNERLASPQILRTSLYLASEFYRTLKVEVFIIKKPKDEENPGEDRSFYGNEIGRVPWMEITPNDCQIDYKEISKGDITAGHDFLMSRLANDDNILINDIDSKKITFQQLGFIDNSQLFLEREIPFLLFPAEDHIISYPRNLWSYNM